MYLSSKKEGYRTVCYNEISEKLLSKETDSLYY